MTVVITTVTFIGVLLRWIMSFILEDMIESGSDIEQYVDLRHVKYLIENAYSKYVFDDPFDRDSMPE